MANWNAPALTDNYATGILQVLMARDVDSASLFNSDGTNMPDNVFKYDRVANKFQERITGAWVDKVLGIAGGGTGGATQAAARTSLGIGTLGVQNSNAVSISGGTVSGLTSLGVTGAVTIVGNVSATSFSGNGAAVTSLDGANVATGTINPARLGSGTPNTTTFLRGDSTWVAPASIPGVPQGGIMMFDTTCPSGWTRFTPLDARFPRGAATYGATGGAATHNHSSGSYATASHNHGGFTNNAQGGFGVSSGSGSFAGSHNHSIPSSSSPVNGTSGDASTLPPYLDVVFCKKD